MEEDAGFEEEALEEEFLLGLVGGKGGGGCGVGVGLGLGVVVVVLVLVVERLGGGGEGVEVVEGGDGVLV